MGLFKNLYLDLSFLNPFKKKKSQNNESKNVSEKTAQIPTPSKEVKELPPISKRLLDKKQEDKKRELPKIKKRTVAPPPKFDEEKYRQATKKEKSPEIPMRNAPKGSFFNDLHKHLDMEKSYMHASMPEKLLKKNLMDEMQSFWKDKKKELETAKLSKGMKSDLSEKIQHLQQLELEWQELQLKKERLEDELSSKEILIDNEIRTLRKTFKKLHYNAQIKPEHHFVLRNGDRVRNLNELATELRDMDESVFNHHVNEHKNDFAAWINDVMGLSELSQNLSTVQNKDEMYNILENWQFSV